MASRWIEAKWRVESLVTTDSSQDRHQLGHFNEGICKPLRLPPGSGGQGDLLPELQDGAGVHDGDHLQGKRAEDEDKGGVRILVTVDVVNAYLITCECEY